MRDIYLDTSVLVKRYVLETGSQWVESLVEDSQNIVYLSQLTIVEIISALKKKQRMGEIEESDYQLLKAEFFTHCLHGKYRIAFPNQDVFNQAIRLLENYVLRAYDSIQLSTALCINHDIIGAGGDALLFMCSDQKLSSAAQHEGLSVDDPTETEKR